MKKTKILYLIPQLLVGGTERHLCELVTHLNKEKFEVIVWCTGQWGSIGDEIASKGIKVINQPLRFYRVDDIIKGILITKNGNFSIFHSYDYGSFVIDPIIAKIAGVPIYISSRRNLRHWKGGYKLHIGERIRNKISDVIVANSEAVKIKSIEVEKINSDKIKVIYNGIDVEENDNIDLNLKRTRLRNKFNVPDNYIVIGNLANFKKTKGQEYLIQAFATLLKRTNKKLICIIIGEGPEKEKLVNLAKELGIDKYVIIDTLKDNRFEIISSFDIFVLPSLTEGFPNVIIEAMSIGKPVIATDVGGNGEAVINGKTGYLVPPKDPEAITNAIINLISNKTNSKEFGQAGKKRVNDEFLLEEMVKKHELLYVDFSFRGKH